MIVISIIKLTENIKNKFPFLEYFLLKNKLSIDMYFYEHDQIKINCINKEIFLRILKMQKVSANTFYENNNKTKEW